MLVNRLLTGTTSLACYNNSRFFYLGHTVVQNQNAVTVYFSSKELLYSGRFFSDRRRAITTLTIIHTDFICPKKPHPPRLIEHRIFSLFHLESLFQVNTQKEMSMSPHEAIALTNMFWEVGIYLSYRF